MVTHGTSGDWFVWLYMLVASLSAAFGCYRRGRREGAADGEVLDVAYGGLMLVFLIVAFLVLIHAPFHVSITSG